jgi:hypothetical protein
VPLACDSIANVSQTVAIDRSILGEQTDHLSAAEFELVLAPAA